MASQGQKNKRAVRKKGIGEQLPVREADQLRGMSVRQFAQAVGLGLTRCYVEIQLGRIHVLKAGSRTIIPTTEVEAFFKRLAAAQAKSEGGR